MIGIEAMRRKFVWRTLLVVSLCLVLSVVASETSMNLNNVVKYYGKRALLIVALCLIAAAAFCACVVGVCVDWRGNN